MFKDILGSTLPAKLLLLIAMIFTPLLMLSQTASADHDFRDHSNPYVSGHTYKIISKNGSQIWNRPSQFEVSGRAARTYYRTNSGVVIYQKTPSFERHSGYQSYPAYQQKYRGYQNPYTQKHYHYKAHPHKRPHAAKKYSHALRQQLYQKQLFYKNLSGRHGYHSKHNKYGPHQRKKSYHRKPNGQIVIILK